MTFVLYIHGRLVCKTSHFYVVLDEIGYLKDNYSLDLIVQSLISSKEYHLETYEGDRLIDIFVYG